MTMDMKENEATFLSESLFENKRPLTYRMVARKLNLHHSIAKKLIYDFYSANQDKLSATFIITGIDSDDSVHISRSTEQELEARSKSLKAVHTVHIYSLCSKDTFPSNPQISLEESNYALDYANLDHYFDQGIIRGPDLVVVTSLATSKRPVSLTSLSSSAIKEESSSPKPLDSGLSSKYVSRKAAVASSKPLQQAHTTGLSSNYVSRKASAKPNPPSKASSSEKKPAYEYKSRKAEVKPPKERVIISSGDQDTMEDDKPAMRPSSSDIHKLFADDSDFSDQEDSSGTPAKPEPEAVLIPEEENEDEVDVEELQTEDTTHKNPQEEQESNTREAIDIEEGHVAPEQESYYDEEGYLVTVKKEEKRPQQQPVRKNVRKPKNELAKPGPTKKKKGQASLMSFFQPNK